METPLRHSADKIFSPPKNVHQRWPADDTVPERLLKIYEYWRGKGFAGIIVHQILSLLTILFMLSFSSFLVLCLDYTLLFNTYILSDSIHKPTITTPPQAIFSIFIAIFLLFWLYQLLSLVHTAVSLWDIRAYCRDKLGLTTGDLLTMTWKEVLDTLKENQGDTLCSDDQKDLSHLDIVNIIMQQDNYMIALINTDILDIRIPLLGIDFMNQALEWGIRICLFNFIFSAKGRGVWKSEGKERASIAEMASVLRWRFRCFGIVGLIISPFVFVSLLMYFFFKYGEQVKNSPGKILGVREWSPLARWKFRDFNELPHLFEKRIKKSYRHANLFVEYFDSYLVGLLARFFSFLLGSIVVVLIVAAIYDDDFLLYTHIGSRSALVVLTLLGTVLAVVREFIPPEHKVIEPNRTILKMATHTHYLPDNWVDAAHTPKVQEEFFTLYPYNIVLWATEAAGIILAPIIMIFSLPSNAESIIQFFRHYTVELMENVPMCKFATFDMKGLANLDYVPPAPSEFPRSLRPTPPGTSKIPDFPTVPIGSSEFKSIPVTTGSTTPSLAAGSARRRKEEVELEEIVEEDKEKKGKKKKKVKMEGTKGVRKLLKQNREMSQSISKDKEDSTTMLLKPIQEISEPYEEILKPSKYGKMEMSLINFKSTYPKWNPDGEKENQIQSFLDNINSMQHHHVDPTHQNPTPPGPWGSDMTMSFFDPSSLDASIMIGDYPALAHTRDLQLELEETYKENMQSSLLLFSVNQIITRKMEQSHLNL